MTLRAAAEQALNALDYAADRVFSEGDDDPIGEARAALRAALAAEQPQPEAQPVAWREHVEQRIRSWRQRTMNRYGDRLAIDDYMSADAIGDLVDYVCDEYAAPPPSAPCPHIRSSGVGDHATHWCALNGPPAVPEPSEAQVEAAWRAIPASHEDSRVSVITKGDVWVMLRAAAAARNNNPA